MKASSMKFTTEMHKFTDDFFFLNEFLEWVSKVNGSSPYLAATHGQN